MAKAPQRAPVLGPAFIRLLARFTDADVSRPPPALSERLNQWFDWNRAITLSRALDGRLSEALDGADFDSAEDAGCARMRATLLDSIHAGVDTTTPRRISSAEREAHAGYAPYRQHYLAVQRAMLATTGNLRGRLREMLARQSPAKARLAEVDAVMEASLSPREHSLLSTVPALLGTHFSRLHAAHRQSAAPPEPPDISEDAEPAPSGPWLAVFEQDLRTALLAELDIRFHPVDGLLAALRTR
ncbi:DUF3348 domain-containing protein [Stenotrophomonas sp. YIM B06876]|uniref:DUF3348 domain-containing protein n=1 Tax=Stenotrophomonas sp. YIM B06876 TaxID=3060211 RepID=UPI0027386D21|nr:DUF3348 domain-containing protein [Stenotrophomonas sp. YIM B06876]